MDNKVKISTPRYQQIAMDVASEIAQGNFKIGDKLFARSSLASKYGVSSETARRAICVLSDLNIVESIKGSGVIIKSYDNAIKFIKQYNQVETINTLKMDLLNSVKKQKEELDNFTKSVNDLIDKTERFKSVNPFMPSQINITTNIKYLNMSLAEINFWHNTNATVIAIKRGDDLLLSPGPYAVLMDNDILYFIGDEKSIERVSKFLFE